MTARIATEAEVDTITTSDLGIITRKTPLLLEVAARIAFPDGSMKVKGLRREIKRGRLGYEEICGRHYTTLADIDMMRELCRVSVRAPGSSSETPSIGMESCTLVASGSSGMAINSSPQDALRNRLTRKRQLKQSKS